MDRICRTHRFLREKHIYFLLWLAFGVWVVLHFNMANYGSPLTDDTGRPLFHH